LSLAVSMMVYMTAARSPALSEPATGSLRGVRDQSAAVEFRFRDGNSMWFPYSLAWSLAV